VDGEDEKATAADEGEEPRRHGTVTAMEAPSSAIRSHSIFSSGEGGGSSVYTTWVCPWWVRKTFFLAETLSKLRFLILHSPSTLSTSKTYDRWVRSEGYGGTDLGEKSFQLSINTRQGRSADKNRSAPGLGF
jgi:hypothetical protein